jgi:hypothetical protein
MAALARATADAIVRFFSVEDFMAVPFCRSSDIAVFERLRSDGQWFSALSHEGHPLVTCKAFGSN